MSTYKLHYFNLRGRAETSRILFKLHDQPFEDIRYSFEQWPTIKPNTPFGQLPYMEVDGEVICQSHTMERLLAKRFGRYGDTDMEQAKTDMVTDCMEDIGKTVLKCREEKDEKKSAELKKTVLEESLPIHLADLEKMATPTGFLPGKSVMLPDIYFFTFADFLQTVLLEGKGLLDLEKTPNLKAILQTVASEPRIAAWVEERPQSEI